MSASPWHDEGTHLRKDFELKGVYFDEVFPHKYIAIRFTTEEATYLVRELSNSELRYPEDMCTVEVYTNDPRLLRFYRITDDRMRLRVGVCNPAVSVGTTWKLDPRAGGVFETGVVTKVELVIRDREPQCETHYRETPL